MLPTTGPEHCSSGRCWGPLSSDLLLQMGKLRPREGKRWSLQLRTASRQFISLPEGFVPAAALCLLHLTLSLLMVSILCLSSLSVNPSLVSFLCLLVFDPVSLLPLLSWCLCLFPSLCLCSLPSLSLCLSVTHRESPSLPFSPSPIPELLCDFSKQLKIKMNVFTGRGWG